jgi:hypothetical protein
VKTVVIHRNVDKVLGLLKSPHRRVPRETMHEGILWDVPAMVRDIDEERSRAMVHGFATGWFMGTGRRERHATRRKALGTEDPGRVGWG